MSEREFLIQRMNEIGLPVSDRQVEQFELFFCDLVEKNRVMNLTTITDWEDVVVKHYVDSLAIIKICDLRKGSFRVLDVGTGAGFPGIPLAIMFPDLKIVMADSVGKKISFIREEIEKLHLTRAEALHERVEEMARKEEYREKFDYCVSRAVANLSTLSEYCLPFVKTGGSFIAYKSGNCQKEMEEAQNAVRMLSGKIIRTEKYVIGGHESPELNSALENGQIQVFNVEKENLRKEDLKNASVNSSFSRTLIEIKKVGITSAKYPRKAGIPSRSPLS
ncbi:MAG: 16S rRNA (guanine(527)-N(7))-methyltransferase RsmG [Lachnospiraceae bacterium]|nr:16S rRNA (guanine(527)-N(7))-methyltransferase RsmG [Lachnospiraceae bacterium]